MKEPKNVKELYEFLIKYLTYKHLIHKYGDEFILDIMELSNKGYMRNFVRNRYLCNGEGFVLSYGKASTMQDVWRMYINERSA